jgi:acetyl-CoA C-acetyltransferase
MTRSYILGGCRTPIGKLLGGLSTVPAPQLAAHSIAETLLRANVAPEAVDEVILGLVLSAGVGQAPARQAALAAGLPPTIAPLTINKVCGSGLKSVMLADQSIRAGDSRAIVAGGMENMSRAPHLVSGARAGWKFGNQTLTDSMLHDGLWCAIEDAAMGQQADYIARKHDISREDQDALAVESHRRAIASAEFFEREIVPVTVSGRKGDLTVQQDEGPRSDTSREALARLKPSFDAAGTVTAGNASQISDGAATVLVVNEEAARASDAGLKFRILASTTTGVAPREIFIAPVSAIDQVVAKAGVSLTDVDLVELNEAFAAQVLACTRSLKLDLDKVNVHGGAIALGHPIGASGARVLVTLMHALAERDLTLGLASLCLGGGNAVAMLIERI